ncbi:Putative ribonuclease H protein At1g65750 [Linum perenne]
MPDEWKWSFTNNGEFTVRSAYHANRKLSENLPPPNPGNINDKMWKWLWSLSLSPKIRFFLWICTKETLATKINLYKRRCSPDELCQICCRETESSRHCLFTCPHAREVWQNLLPTISPPLVDTDFAQWIFPRFALAGIQEIRKLAAILWNIWKARNEKVFRETNPTLFSKSLKVSRDLEIWKDCTTNIRHDHSPPPHLHPCPPPRIADLVIHCDGSFKKDSPKAAYGVVMTNTHGQVCDGRSGTFFCSSPIVAEAKAINEAVFMASTRQVSTLILSDSLSLVNILNDTHIQWPWECAALITQIGQRLSVCLWITISFTPRSLNTKADWVAKSARMNCLPANWIDSLNA